MKFGFRKPRAIARAVQLPHSNPDDHGHPQNCLNCGAALVGAYCHDCGQSAHTHRMSFKHFLLHDFVHGVWHLDKGFPATLKKAFVNPGKEIRAYLAGKRAGWFSILTMILLLYAAIAYFTPEQNITYGNEASKKLVLFLKNNAKWLVLGLAFVCSWSSYLIFRRPKLNFSEHTIINCFFLIGMLVITFPFVIIKYESDSLDYLLFTLIIVYLIYGYYGAFRPNYSFGGWIWRILTHGLLSLAFLFILMLAGIGTFLKVNKEKSINFEFDSKAPDTTIHHAPTTH